MLVLVVDDEPQLCDLLRDVLEIELGIDVLCAPDGLVALEVLRDAKPDLVLLDIMMPGMDGFEVLRHMHARADTSDIPVIAVTASDTRDKVLGLGCVGFIQKPFSIDALLSTVECYLPQQLALPI